VITTKPTAIPKGANDMNTAQKGVPMSWSRKVALAAGVLFLITFITSIPAQLLLYHPLLTDPAKYMLGHGGDPAVSLGALMEVLLAISGVGTAVVLYPVVKRQNQAVALAYVTSRVLESAAIMVGIFSVMSVVTLRHDFAGATGADTASLITAARSLVAVHDVTFLLGPTLLAGVGNGVLLGYLMYRSGLVPRRLALFGVIGGPMVIAATVCVLFGVFKAGSSWQFLATIPEIIWEFSFGIYCTFKGFRPSPITTASESILQAA
jgi:hypothetical protein